MSYRKKFDQNTRHAVYAKCNGRCAYCGTKIGYKDMQVDHVTPLKLGGSDSIENMLPTCRSCNHYKSTLTVEKFRKYISGIHERLMRDSIPYQVGVRFGLIHSSTDVTFYYEKMKQK